MKVKTIPNLVTLLRLFLTPFIIYFILSSKIKYALILFIIATLSDKLDGFLARKLKQATKFGVLFDNLTDAVLLFSALIVLHLEGYLSLKYLMILLTPKIITFIIGALQKRSYQSTIYSKLTSVILYAVVIILMINANMLTIKILMIAFYILSVVHWFLLFMKR